jgi:hypothetical protein
MAQNPMISPQATDLAQKYLRGVPDDQIMGAIGGVTQKYPNVQLMQLLMAHKILTDVQRKQEASQAEQLARNGAKMPADPNNPAPVSQQVAEALSNYNQTLEQQISSKAAQPFREDGIASLDSGGLGETFNAAQGGIVAFNDGGIAHGADSLFVGPDGSAMTREQMDAVSTLEKQGKVPGRDFYIDDKGRIILDRGAPASDFIAGEGEGATVRAPIDRSQLPAIGEQRGMGQTLDQTPSVEKPSTAVSTDVFRAPGPKVVAPAGLERGVGIMDAVLKGARSMVTPAGASGNVGLGALLHSAEAGAGSDVVPGRREPVLSYEEREKANQEKAARKEEMANSVGLYSAKLAEIDPKLAQAKKNVSSYGLKKQRDDPDGYKAAQEEVISLQLQKNGLQNNYEAALSASGKDIGGFRALEDAKNRGIVTQTPDARAAAAATAPAPPPPPAAGPLAQPAEKNGKGFNLYYASNQAEADEILDKAKSTGEKFKIVNIGFEPDDRSNAGQKPVSNVPQDSRSTLQRDMEQSIYDRYNSMVKPVALTRDQLIARDKDTKAKILKDQGIEDVTYKQRIDELTNSATQAKKDRDTDRLLSAAEGFFAAAAGTSPYALQNFAKGAGITTKSLLAAEQEYRKGEKTRLDSIASMKQAQRAEAIGDFDRVLKEEEKQNALLEKYDAHQLTFQGIILGRITSADAARANAQVLAQSKRDQQDLLERIEERKSEDRAAGLELKRQQAILNIDAHISELWNKKSDIDKLKLGKDGEETWKKAERARLRKDHPEIFGVTATEAASDTSGFKVIGSRPTK